MKILIVALVLTVFGVLTAGARPAEVQRRWAPEVDGLKVAEGATFDPKEDAWQVKAGPQAVVPILVDERPGVGERSYRLSGEVKFEGVGGTGFLETWTGIGSGKAFSRTLGDYGPMQKLQGKSAWREFILPMNMTGASDPVSRIEFNAVLPDGGTVWVKNLRLEPFTLPAEALWLKVGVPAAIVTVLALGVLFWRLSRRRVAKARELSRMMAADA